MQRTSTGLGRTLRGLPGALAASALLAACSSPVPAETSPVSMTPERSSVASVTRAAPLLASVAVGPAAAPMVAPLVATTVASADALAASLTVSDPR